MTAREWRPAAGRLAVQVLIVSLLSSAPTFGRWQMQEFLILYSQGWPAEQVAEHLTEVGARQIAAAHYNTVMCAASELELIARAGLRCLAMGRSRGAPDWVGEALSPAIARTWAANPAVWGYYVMDEPDNRNVKRGALFEQLADTVKSYEAADPNHVAWINMSSATGSFLTNYMEVVKPPLLSFDLYRWWARESDWWRGLEAHRDAALKAHVPMIMWLESNSSEQRFNANLPPPQDNAAKLRWSVYTSLAYGSKGVQWFLGSTREDVADLNAELAAMGATLISLESKHVFHTSAVPKEGQRLPDSSWYFTEAPNLVIGEFANPGETNASYLLIANKSIDADCDAVLQIQRRSATGVQEVNRKTVGRTDLPLEMRRGAIRVPLHLAAGDGRLIRIAMR